MTVRKWNEAGADWDDDHGWLDPHELSLCARADVAEPTRSPVPTRMISNGEYLPLPQTENQSRVEARVQELADAAARKLGMSRRSFLASSGGMAAAFLAMNEVFGRLFDVDAVELYEPAAYAAGSVPRNLFVFDDQLHFVRGSDRTTGAAYRALAQGPTAAPTIRSNPLNPKGLPDERGQAWSVWNPALVGLPVDPGCFHIVQFIKDVYLDSQVTVGLLSGTTGLGEPPSNVEEAQATEILTAAQIAAARNFVNEISGSTRMLAHGLLYVGKANLRYIQGQIDANEPDSWKGYNALHSAKVPNSRFNLVQRMRHPDSLMQRWRHDDEEVAYPTFDLIQKNYERLKDKKPGLRNICVHKGLSPSGPAIAEMGHPEDLPKAARDWPKLNFITYHACIRPNYFLHQSLEEIKSGRLRGGVPDIQWTTEYAQLVAPYPNCYADLGTTWASSVVTFPTVAAHILGQLMKFMGPDRIVFGSDSVWYGSPQWQIEAMWRFQIPEELRQRYGYPELTEAAKRKILGLNSARLYGLQDVGDERARDRRFLPVPKDYESRMPEKLRTTLELPARRADRMSEVKERYLALGAERSNARYGWIRTAV